MRPKRRLASLLLGAAAVVVTLWSTAPVAIAQKRALHCVMEKGRRICRIDVSTSERKRYAPEKRFGKVTTKMGKTCRPGTRPDGRWYLVKCKTGMCKARCRVIRG
jgi:hypothetical protein